jgi:hypothetical protein
MAAYEIDIDITAKYADSDDGERFYKQRGDIGTGITTALAGFFGDEVDEGRSAAQEVTLRVRAEIMSDSDAD